jgi:hypothetical protein
VATIHGSAETVDATAGRPGRTLTVLASGPYDRPGADRVSNRGPLSVRLRVGFLR